MQLRRCLNVNVAFKNRVIVDDKSGVVDYTLRIDAEETLLQSSHCSGRDRRGAGAEGATAPETLRQMNRAIT